MTKEEFLIGLRTALAGEIPDSEVHNNIKFYEDYIKDKSKTDREEEELSRLGDPRLIAKTIIETYQLSHGPLYHNTKANNVYQDADTRDWNEEEDGTNSQQEYENNYNGSTRNFTINIGGRLTWYQKALLALIFVIIFIALIIIGGLIMRILFIVGIPILLIYLGYVLIFGNRKF